MATTKLEDPKKAILHKTLKKHMKPTVYLVRHGQTKLNQDTNGSVERIRGWKDIPLNERGQEEAQELADHLKGSGIKKIYSSPFGRAFDTAKKIGEAVKVKPVKEDALKPWHLGDWEGKPVKEILADMKDHQVHADKSVPGGESWKVFTTRYISFLRKIMAEAKTSGEVICAVAHFRNLAVARGFLKTGFHNDSIDLSELDKAAKDLDTGDCLKISWDGKKWVCEVESV